MQHDDDLGSEKLPILRREIDIGLEAAAAGRFTKKTMSDIADEVRREHSELP